MWRWTASDNFAQIKYVLPALEDASPFNEHFRLSRGAQCALCMCRSVHSQGAKSTSW